MNTARLPGAVSARSWVYSRVPHRGIAAEPSEADNISAAIEIRQYMPSSTFILDVDTDYYR